MFSSSSGIHFINTFLLRKYNVTKADLAAPVLWNCYLFREADESGCSLAISDSFDVLPAAFKCFQVFLGPIWWAKSWIPTREMVPSFQLFSDWHSNVSSNFLEPKRRGTLASCFFADSSFIWNASLSYFPGKWHEVGCSCAWKREPTVFTSWR